MADGSDIMVNVDGSKADGILFDGSNTIWLKVVMFDGSTVDGVNGLWIEGSLSGHHMYVCTCMCVMYKNVCTYMYTTMHACIVGHT